MCQVLLTRSEPNLKSGLFDLRSTTAGVGEYHFEIDSVVFLDEGENATDEITENGSISYVNLTKLTDDIMPATVIVAIYGGDGRLRGVYLSGIDGNETIGEPIVCPFDAPLGGNTYGLNIKVFVWDSMTNLVPLAGLYQHIDGRGMTTNISTVAGQPSILTISASGITSLSGKTFTVYYDSAALSLVDVVAATPQNDTAVGVVATTGIEILDISSGSFTFTVDKTIPNGYKWDGVLDMIKFNGLKTGTTIVTVTVE